MLRLRKLEVFYGPIRAVRGIDLDVETGEVVALIGANGAGKTSTLRAVAGLLPYRGEIIYQGRALVPNKAERNLREGLALVPEGRGILGRMSVEDNLRMGVYVRADRAEAAADIERMFERFPILKERRTAMASLLSGGEQQMLAIARAAQPSAPSSARRAFARPGAEDERLCLRHHRRLAPARTDGSTRRAESAAGAEVRQSRLPDGDRAGDRLGLRRRPRGRSSYVRSLLGKGAAGRVRRLFAQRLIETGQ